jgi:CDP-glucose 4,6-dehydratase
VRRFWQGKRVLVTGHTGFKGSWLWLWLESLGAETFGYSLPPTAEPNLYQLAAIGPTGDRERLADIRDDVAFKSFLQQTRPEIVFHLAAQPLVRESYRKPRETFDTNVMGTVNVLEAMRGNEFVQAAVIVTSDKCYDARAGVHLKENDPLGGLDPYSASKAAAELVCAAYRHSYAPGHRFPQLATARAGNVIGGGDWSDDRLVPDMLRSALSRQPVSLRYPQAIRPWQHVLEPLAGYLQLAMRLCPETPEFAAAWNFGPSDEGWSVERLARQFLSFWPEARNPEYVATESVPYETPVLRLDSRKAMDELGWQPRLTTAEAVRWTAEWYREWALGSVAPRQSCLQQIFQYQQLL